MNDVMMRSRFLSLLASLLLVLVAAGPAVTLHAQPEPVDEFVPIEQLPPQDQLPAAPLLVAAYSFVVVALFVYVLSVARRLGSVQRDMARLESEMKRSGHP
jgi:hypothetical protein